MWLTDLTQSVLSRTKRWWGFLAGRNPEEKGAATKDWNLVPLTPGYKEDQHAVYVDALEKAIKDDKVLNIALSGNYGVGKSSILQGLADRLKGRVLELSLSTLAPIKTSDLDDSIPKQATTPTNRIQQEIVKQLLYREVPGRMLGSRFERIERFKWGREFGISGLIGFVVAVAFLLTGWADQIATVFNPLLDVGLWIHLFILAAAVCCAFIVRRISYGRIHIKQFSAGVATVTLDDKSVSYFDQYLDEIVHFFEVSKQHDVVIFEDIDRFNDSHIFEALRSLNTLLNVAPQINRNIRFIYAIKDSIFDKKKLEEQGREDDHCIDKADDPAQAEAIRANRTKFFDLVIPVVPFITHRSARNLASQLLKGMQHNVNPELIDLAAQYVPDMRLLVNVRNEFIVFRDRIFAGDGEKLKLSETALFSMMLYKSTHLSDFEAMRNGTSKLDQLYGFGRKLVASNIGRIERERRALQRRLDRVNGADSRSEYLGLRLINHALRTMESVGVSPRRELEFHFRGVARPQSVLTEPEFWREFASVKANDAILQWNNPVYSSRQPQSLTFTRANLVKSLGDPIDIEVWDDNARDSLKRELAEKQEELTFLRSADMGALIKRSEFLVEYYDKEQSLGAVARDLLKDGLAYQLVRAGFIDRDFTLYTSTFHGDRVSSSATNFIIHHVECDVMDPQFELTPEDVEMVVRERGREALKESALYNIAILDHLLEKDLGAADIMISSLAKFGDDERQFLQAYLGSGKQRRKLIERLTPMSLRILTYLDGEVELEESLRLQLVDAALASLAPNKKYKTDEKVASYLLENYEQLPAVAAQETTVIQAERIANIFEATGTVVPTLASVGENMRRALVKRNLYEISLANLIAAMPSGTSLALDSLSSEDETVYQYCLENLEAYLDAVDGEFATVDGVQNFAEVIEDVVKSGDQGELDRVVAGSAEDCVIETLDDVTSDAWPALARNQRFPATLENVTRYIGSVGSIDLGLATLLSESGEILVPDSVEEEEKEALAGQILIATKVLPSAELRTRIVQSLGLKMYLDVGVIPAEKGELFGFLRARGIIADNATSYVRLAGLDWPTREVFVQASKKFQSYVTPEILGDDLASLLQSEKVGKDVKLSILERADEFVVNADELGLIQLAQLAVQENASLSETTVLAMARGGVQAQTVVVLLGHLLATMHTDQLFTILQLMGGEYSKLTSVGRDQPKIPNTKADRDLLDRLKLAGIVSSYDPSSSLILVHKRRK